MSTSDPLTVTVRPLEAGDREQWLGLWQVYLTHYGQDLPEATTDLLWERLTGPQPHPRMGGLAAIDGQRGLVGLAHYVLGPNTWDPRDDAYLEDLVTDPAVRGRGVARALIGHLVDLGGQRGWRRVHWITDTGNATARRLYDRVGALTPYVQYERRLGPPPGAAPPAPAG